MCPRRALRKGIIKKRMKRSRTNSPIKSRLNSKALRTKRNSRNHKALLETQRPKPMKKKAQRLPVQRVFSPSRRSQKRRRRMDVERTRTMTPACRRRSTESSKSCFRTWTT